MLICVLMAGSLAACRSGPKPGGAAHSPEAAKTGRWINLFNGKDLSGLRAYGDARWRVEDGILVGSAAPGADKAAGALLAEGAFEDFLVEVEARVNEGGNSGLFLRAAPPPEGRSDPIAYEAQIRNREPNPTGSFYTITATRAWAPVPAPASLAKDGEWFTLHVIARGSRLESYVNGRHQATMCDDGFPRGAVGLQMHDAKTRVEFRRFRIAPLPRATADGPWTDLFNGKDLAGWRTIGGAAWRADGGRIVCEAPPGGKHGTLLTARNNFDDFELEVEAKIGARGNSGLFFRAQAGDHGVGGDFWPACYEAQIYHVDPKAATGFLYMLLPETAYVFQEGRQIASKDEEWFTMRVLAQGPRIRTWVNGRPIADAWDCKFRRGGIGLQAHAEKDAVSRVEFRAVRVRPAPPIEAESPIRFRQIAIDSGKNEGCAVADIDKDGKPDIVAGPYWYAGPDWVRRPLREIPLAPPDTREYLATHGDQVVDVDGDGWPDVISGGWFGPAIAWYRNPGGEALAKAPKACDLWEAFPVGELPHQEGGLHMDLDGDGIQDLLLNSYRAGTPVAYWRLARKKGAGKFVRREIGKEGMLHGMGAGDIDGDGRPDILTPAGWYRAPQKSGGEWAWNPWPEAVRVREDKKLPSPKVLGHCSVPMLVHDVTGDGLNDVIFGQGHDYGLEWLEQVKRPDGASDWALRPIDATFSQVHAIALADLDGDGAPELIAGKRWRAHGPGGDPGAAEPQCLFWYKWIKGEGRFEKHVLSYDRGAGTGMQIAAADLDGDGDVDIAVAGKGGLYVFYNGMASR